MIICARRNIILHSRDRARQMIVHRGYLGEVPDWAVDTDYFRQLVRDGKITATESRKESDITAAVEAPAKPAARKRKKEE